MLFAGFMSFPSHVNVCAKVHISLAKLCANCCVRYYVYYFKNRHTRS